MHKKYIFLFGFLLLILTAFIYPLLPSHASSPSSRQKIVIFWGRGCPHCAKVEKFINDNRLNDYFDIENKEIYFDKENRDEFARECDKYNIPMEERGVPMALIGNKYIVGDTPIIKELESMAQNINSENQAGSPEIQINNNNHNKENTERPAAKSNSANNYGNVLNLPLVIGAAFVDSINPCAFAVLIILIMTILSAGSRKKALFAGIMFSIAIYISYLLMGLGVYKALAVAGFSNWFIKFIGVLAILVGILNVKDYFWYGGGGFIMEVPQSWRPKMKSLIYSVTSPIGAFLIGIVVSLFLLPCTSGPYIVILGMLSQKETFFPALWWLLLYNLIFILPMIAIILACYFGLKPEKIESIRQKKLKILHLIAGLIMVSMGIIILLFIC